VRLVYRTPALQLAPGTYHLPGPALIALAFMVYLLMRLRAAPGPVPLVGYYLPNGAVFMG
jgi:hypothetical protein